MRKQLSIALAALVLVACGGGSSDNNLINNITANNITGKWDGSFAGFTSSTTINGNVTMTLAQRDPNGAFEGGVSLGKIKIISGVYTSSSGSAGSVSGTFDGSSFTGSLTPSVATICPANIVLLFSYNSLKGTAIASNCAVSASAQGTFSKQ